jgi:hypothetical protein
LEIYIYIYIYIERERERERDGGRYYRGESMILGIIHEVRGERVILGTTHDVGRKSGVLSIISIDRWKGRVGVIGLTL